MEERAHGEIEQRLALSGDAGRTVAAAEERVAALLQAEQHAALVVPHQALNLVEGKNALAVASEDAAHALIGQQESAEDVHKDGGRLQHGPTIGALAEPRATLRGRSAPL